MWWLFTRKKKKDGDRKSGGRGRKTTRKPHYSVYVVKLDKKVVHFGKVKTLNPRRDKALPCIYVGMTGLKPEERFKKHKKGYKASSWVKKYGLSLMPELYRHLNPMTYDEAVKMEKKLAEQLRNTGYAVLGGH